MKKTLTLLLLLTVLLYGCELGEKTELMEKAKDSYQAAKDDAVQEKEKAVGTIKEVVDKSYDNLIESLGIEGLIDAINYGDVQFIREFMQKGVDLSAVQFEHGKNILIYAVESGKIDMVREILNLMEVDLNYVDVFGWSALTYAVANGNMDMVELLVQSGAGLDILDNNESTLLMIAVQNSSVEMVEMLLELGFDNIQAVNADGYTVFDYAGENKEVLNILKEYVGYTEQ